MFGLMNAGPDVFAEDWEPGSALAKDGNGAQVQAVATAIKNMQTALKRRMDAGLSQDEFAQAQALEKSLSAALAGYEMAWKRRHKR